MTESWVDEYLHLLQDPAHWMFEITVSIIFDLLVVGLIWQVVIKKHIIPKLRKEIHAEIDREHDLEHKGHGHSAVKIDLGEMVSFGPRGKTTEEYVVEVIDFSTDGMLSVRCVRKDLWPPFERAGRSHG